MRGDFEDVNEGNNIVKSKTRNKKLIKSGFLLELKIDVTSKILELVGIR
jgi:pantothenate kinase